MFLKSSNFLRTLFDGQNWDNHKCQESGNRMSVYKRVAVECHAPQTAVSIGYGNNIGGTVFGPYL